MIVSPFHSFPPESAELWMSCCRSAGLDDVLWLRVHSSTRPNSWPAVPPPMPLPTSKSKSFSNAVQPLVM